MSKGGKDGRATHVLERPFQVEGIASAKARGHV